MNKEERIKMIKEEENSIEYKNWLRGFHDGLNNKISNYNPRNCKLCIRRIGNEFIEEELIYKQKENCSGKWESISFCPNCGIDLELATLMDFFK